MPLLTFIYTFSFRHFVDSVHSSLILLELLPLPQDSSFPVLASPYLHWGVPLECLEK